MKFVSLLVYFFFFSIMGVLFVFLFFFLLVWSFEEFEFHIGLLPLGPPNQIIIYKLKANWPNLRTQELAGTFQLVWMFRTDMTEITDTSQDLGGTLRPHQCTVFIVKRDVPVSTDRYSTVLITIKKSRKNKTHLLPK